MQSYNWGRAKWAPKTEILPGTSVTPSLGQTQVGNVQTWDRLETCSAWEETSIYRTLSALFWYLMQRKIVIPCRRFGTPYQAHLQRSSSSRINSLKIWPWKIGPIGCPETSAWIYHTKLGKSPEDRRTHLHRGGSLKSQKLKELSENGS